MHRVHTKGLSKSEKRAIWDEIIQDFISSDLGLTKYSKQHGLRYDHLSYYVSSYRRKQTSDFISVPMPISSSTQCDSKIHIQTNGISLSVPLNVSSVQLSNILQGIVAIC